MGRWWGALSLQETSEFFNGETGLANDGTKSTLGYFFMPRDSKPTMRRIVFSQDDVTASLMINTIAGFGESPAKLVSRNQGQSSQMATSTISSSIGGGIGSLCFCRLSK